MHAGCERRGRSCLAYVALAISLSVAGCIMGDSLTDVEGIVVDDGGVPLCGVTVTFRPQASQADLAPARVTTTDDEGRFFVGQGHAPVPSKFIVEAKKQGFRRAEITVQGCTVHRGVRIVLVRESGEPAFVPEKTER